MNSIERETGIKSFIKNPLIYWPIIGVILVEAFAGIFNSQLSINLKEGIEASHWNLVIDFLFRQKSDAELMLMGLFLLGIVFNYAIKYAGIIWDNSIFPMFENEVKNIELSIANTFRLGRTKEHLEKMSADEVKNALPTILSKLYGNHCLRADSLPQAVINNFTPFFQDTSPHRSTITKVITITDRDDGTVGFHEVSRYRIHSIALDPAYFHPNKEAPSSCLFPLKYFSEAIVGSIESEDDLKKQQIIISLDDEFIFNSSKDLHFKDGEVCTSNEYVTDINYDGHSLRIEFLRNIELTEAWESVEIEEKTVMSEEDTYYCLKSSQPYCGCNITFTIPHGWSFHQVDFQNNDWRHSTNPPFTLSASNSKWVLPGIIFTCSWKKPKKNASHKQDV